MDLVGGNADLGAEAVFEAVGKTGRGVDHDARRIDLAQKATRAAVVLGDDGIGVMRAVGVDVDDCGVEVVDHFHCDDGTEIFIGPVGLHRGLQLVRRDAGALEDRQRFRTATHFHALAGEHCADLRQRCGGDTTRHQQRLGGVAGAVALGLGVLDDLQRLGQVGAVIDVHMAVAVQVLDHRHPRLAGDALDQTLAAARHNHIDVVLHGDEFAHRGAVGGLDHLHHACRQPGGLQPFTHAGGDGLVRMQRLGATAQDRGVAGFQAQACGIRRHVGTRLVDDADDAERHPHLADLDARGAVLEAVDFADRIRQRGDLLEAFGHAGDGLVVKLQAVKQRGVEPAGARLRHVARIGFEQPGGIAPDRRRHRKQRAVLLIGVGAGDRARGLARLLAQRLHIAFNVHIFFHCLPVQPASVPCAAAYPTDRPPAPAPWPGGRPVPDRPARPRSGPGPDA